MVWIDQWPFQCALKECFSSVCHVFFKRSSHCFLPHCNSHCVQHYWKTNENAGTTRLYFTVENSQWLQYYVVPNSRGIAFLKNSDFYFQATDPLRSLTPQPLNKHRVTEKPPKRHVLDLLYRYSNHSWINHQSLRLFLLPHPFQPPHTHILIGI